MTSALRWAAMRAILMFHNCEGQSHKTVSTDHNFWRERRAEADSNRGPSAYQPNALPPLGQTGSPPPTPLETIIIHRRQNTQRQTLFWKRWFSVFLFRRGPVWMMSETETHLKHSLRVRLKYNVFTIKSLCERIKHSLRVRLKYNVFTPLNHCVSE